MTEQNLQQPEQWLGMEMCKERSEKEEKALKMSRGVTVTDICTDAKVIKQKKIGEEVVDVEKESQIDTFLRGRASLLSSIEVKEVASESDGSPKRPMPSLTDKSDGISSLSLLRKQRYLDSVKPAWAPANTPRL